LKLLLDTHTALWHLNDYERLSGRAQRHLADRSNPILLSAVVVWEIAIKRSLGKLEAPDRYLSLLLEGKAQELPVTIAHAAAVEQLPWHHRDPFDRLLVAQATVENAAIVSADDRLRAYDVDVIW
jgi:PIN domain nuclease of toxin-antitoxin system